MNNFTSIEDIDTRTLDWNNYNYVRDLRNHPLVSSKEFLFLAFVEIKVMNQVAVTTSFTMDSVLKIFGLFVELGLITNVKRKGRIKIFDITEIGMKYYKSIRKIYKEVILK